MSRVDVVFRGLAFCHSTSGNTKVIFPHAPNHSLTLRITRVGTTDPVEEIEMYDENFINIELTGSASVGKPPLDSSGHSLTNDMVNLTKLHKDYSKPNPVVKLRPRIVDGIGFSYLSMPNGNLFSSSHATVTYEHWVHQKYAKGIVPPPVPDPFPDPNRYYQQDIARLAAEALSPFEVDPRTPGAVHLKFGRFDLEKYQAHPQVPPFTRTFSFYHEDTVNYQVVLDNHCHGNSCGADFGYYYELIQGMTDDFSEVEMELFPAERFETGFPDSEASCNPVMGEPPSCDLESWFFGLCT
jgi:hypothetical protein